MKLHVTENKSVGQINKFTMVRVFIDNDYHYGYFIHEADLFALLSSQQQNYYLSSNDDAVLEVSDSIAKQVIDMGVSPYKRKITQ
jgi:hypothetical protein